MTACEKAYLDALSPTLSGAWPLDTWLEAWNAALDAVSSLMQYEDAESQEFMIKVSDIESLREKV